MIDHAKSCVFATNFLITEMKVMLQEILYKATLTSPTPVLLSGALNGDGGGGMAIGNGISIISAVGERVPASLVYKFVRY